MLFWHWAGRIGQICIFLDKFILHDLIAVFGNLREESDSFVIRRSLLKEERCFVRSLNILRCFEQLGTVYIVFYNQSFDVLICKFVWFCFHYDYVTRLCPFENNYLCWLF